MPSTSILHAIVRARSPRPSRPLQTHRQAGAIPPPPAVCRHLAYHCTGPVCGASRSSGSRAPPGNPRPVCHPLLTPRRRGLHRVAEQVDQYALDLVGVDLHLQRLGRQPTLELDRVGQLDPRQRVVDDLLQRRATEARLAAAAEVEFTVQPSDATADSVIKPPVEVTVRDAQGNVASGYTGNVTLTITDGTGTANANLLGATTVLMARFDADELVRRIERHRISVLAAVSTQFILMLESPELERRDLSSLRALFTGGEAVPYERAATFEERTGASVLQFYGSNETGALSRTTTRDSRDVRLRSAGHVIESKQVRLFDDAGGDVTASFTLNQGNYLSGDGNFSEDPLFVDAEGGDVRLSVGSPALDAGNPTGAPGFDIDGNTRDSAPDLGAYEGAVSD